MTRHVFERDGVTATNLPSGSWVQLTVTGVVQNAANQFVLSGSSNSLKTSTAARPSSMIAR